MQCPKCDSAMEILNYGPEITVHRCLGCRGLFCKRKTLEMIKSEWLADSVLDSGDPKTGRELDKKRGIDCPECGTLMDSVSDQKQVHITIESCPACDGLFLDTGELTDLKRVTLIDHIRGLIARLM